MLLDTSLESSRPTGRVGGGSRPGGSGVRSFRPPRWIVRTLLLYLTSRAMIGLAVLLAIGIAPPAHPSDWLERWDSFWYLDIARHGYPATVGPLSHDLPYSPYAFFPLWPMLIRGGGVLLGGHPVLAAYLLNLLLGGLLAVLVRMLFARVGDGRAADVGVLLFVFFPGTNVFSGAYSEPLALCLAAGTLLALTDQRWVLAGTLAALAGATRPPVAVAVGAAIVWGVVAALRRGQWRALAAVVLAPLGLIAFAGYGWARTGSPLAWHEAEKMFGNSLDFGFSFVSDVSGSLSTDGPTNPAFGLAVLVGIGVVMLLVLGVFFVRRPPPALLVVYTVVVIAVPAVNSALLPKARFLAAGFPLLLPLAAHLARKGRETALGVVVGTEAALLVGLTLMHLLGRLAFP